MVFNLGERDSIANHFLADLRNKDYHGDKARFRTNMKKLGQIMAYEISRTLKFRPDTVRTPLDNCEIRRIKDLPVLITILRAGIPFLEGFLDFFGEAETGFVGAYRREGEETITINLDYAATPIMTDKEVIIIDPMLATGSSLVQTMRHLFAKQIPAKIHIAAVIAAPDGLHRVDRFFKEELNVPFAIWTGGIDKGLNTQFYIVPGLGDAGDLSFGSKH